VSSAVRSLGTSRSVEPGVNSATQGSASASSANPFSEAMNAAVGASDATDSSSRHGNGGDNAANAKSAPVNSSTAAGDGTTPVSLGNTLLTALAAKPAAIAVPAGVTLPDSAMKVGTPGAAGLKDTKRHASTSETKQVASGTTASAPVSGAMALSSTAVLGDVDSTAQAGNAVSGSAGAAGPGTAAGAVALAANLGSSTLQTNAATVVVPASETRASARSGSPQIARVGDSTAARPAISASMAAQAAAAADDDAVPAGIASVAGAATSRGKSAMAIAPSDQNNLSGDADLPASSDVADSTAANATNVATAGVDAATANVQAPDNAATGPVGAPPAAAAIAIGSNIVVQAAPRSDGPISDSNPGAIAATYGANATPSPAPAASPSNAAPSDAQAPSTPEAFASGMAGHLLTLIGSGKQEATFQLVPPELGELTVRVAIQGRDVSAWFGSAQPQVQQVIGQALDQLRSDLAGAGLNLAGAWVGTDASNARERSAAPQSPPPNFTANSRDSAPSGNGQAERRASGVSVYV
jgi:flagellar hook-length control protein FliK